MRRHCALAVATLALAFPPAAGADGAYAPADRPGPPLGAPDATLRSALTCGPGLTGAERSPVLLVAGTGATPEEQYSWNYEPAFTAAGIPWCAITVPDHTLADVQDQAEFIAYAIRTMHAISGRRVSILGHSQGGMTPRWALRFWPDVRAMVDDMISLAADNHGTAAAQLIGACATTCPAAAWQNLPGSRLLDALNSPVETFAGTSYTQIYSNLDFLSTPPGPHGTSPLRTGGGWIANISVQDVCPAATTDHVALGSTDPIGWALVLDALDHPGPSVAARVGTAPCTQATLPHVDAAGAAKAGGAMPYLLAAATMINLPGVTKLTAEPPLRCYVFAACGEATPAAVARLLGKRRRPGLVLTVGVPPDATPLASLRVRLPGGLVLGRNSGARLRIRADGRPGAASRTGRSILLLRAPSAGVRRWSIRVPAASLRLGPGLRARLAARRGAALRVRSTDLYGRRHALSVRLR